MHELIKKINNNNPLLCHLECALFPPPPQKEHLSRFHIFHNIVFHSDTYLFPLGKSSLGTKVLCTKMLVTVESELHIMIP